MRWWPKRTIRSRLTMWHGGLFFLGGLLLLTLTTSLLLWAEVIDRQNATEVGRAAGISDEQLSTDPIGVVRDATVINEIPYDDLQVQIDDVGGIDDLVNFSLVSLALLTVIAAVFGYWSSGRMLRPVSEMSSAAKRISKSNLSERLAFEGPQDELKDLADAFDGMVERLERAFLAQEDFISNASHELRTPLAIMRTELDVNLADQSLTDDDREASHAALREAVARSEGVIDRLLLLAGSGVIGDRVAVDLAQVVTAETEHFEDLGRTRGIEVSLTASSAQTVGDTALLTHLVGNLVQNAIVHNQDGGWVRIETGVNDRGVWLTVSNSGHVIPTSDRDRLFDRFYRSKTARSGPHRGMGLGLPIVRTIARAHGGEATATPRDEGGLEVTITLPRADES